MAVVVTAVEAQVIVVVVIAADIQAAALQLDQLPLPPLEPEVHLHQVDMAQEVAIIVGPALQV